MIKKIILLVLISIAISSCSTYNGFSKRKYFDFPKGTSETIGKMDNQYIKDEITVTKNTQEKQIESVITKPIVSEINSFNSLLNTSTSKKQPSLSDIPRNTISKKKLDTSSKGSVKCLAQNIKHNHSLSLSTEHRPGRFWWLFAIDAVIGLFLALWVSAYIGLALMIFGIVFGIIYLIKFIKSK